MPYVEWREVLAGYIIDIQIRNGHEYQVSAQGLHGYEI